MAVEFGAKLYLKDNMYATLKKNMELQKSYSQQINDTSSSISKLGKQKADPVITAHDKATEVFNSVRENIDNLSQQKALTKAEVQDEASKKVDEIVEKIKEIKKTAGMMFYSCKPYLHLALSRECIITFNEKGVYIAKTPEEEKLLREYAKNTRNSYNIIEAGGELEQEDLIRLHEEGEQKLIAEAEERKKVRAEEKRRKKEQHDFYSLLRM